MTFHEVSGYLPGCTALFGLNQIMLFCDRSVCVCEQFAHTRFVRDVTQPAEICFVGYGFHI